MTGQYICFFNEDEKNRAEQILNLLKGLPISSAQYLLDRCRDALEKISIVQLPEIEAVKDAEKNNVPPYIIH